MAIRTFQRREVKFLLSKAQYDALQPILLDYMNPDKYCVNGKEYGVYNVYYDTDDNFLIRESLAKPYYKKKIGGIVTKRRVTMTLQQANAYIQTRVKPQSEKFLQMQVLKELDVFLNNYAVSPKQYISYQRSAFFGKDNSDFRLTFDRQITARREDISLASGNYGSQIIRPDQRLMEIKVTDSIPKWLSDALSELNIYKTSFSKYGTAYKQYIRSKIEGDRSVMIYA